MRPLFGRSSELATLESTIDGVAAGAGQMAIIEGVAGIGKTRLLHEVLAYAEQRNVRILRGGAEEVERDRPFRAVAEALDLRPEAEDARAAALGRLLAGELERPVPGPASVQPIDFSFRIMESIAALVEEMCSDGPVVVALEDLHWADESTIRTVRSLARRLASSPLALLVTFRPTPSPADLNRAVEDLLERGARHLVLRPLDAAAAVALTASVVAAEPGPELRKQVSGTGGVPLFVIELVEALREEGAIRIAAGRAEVGALCVPPSLRLTILRRMAFLPTETLELLKVAAILGASFTLGDLAIVTGRSLVELLPVLTEAIRAGVLGEAEDRLIFRHDVVREAMYEELPRGIRKDLHREAGRALARAGATPAQVAEQMSLGACPGDLDAVEWLRRAATEAVAGSGPVAVRLLERALELTHESQLQRRPILVELAPLLLAVGRLAEAEEVVREALDLTSDRASGIPLQRALATILFFRGERPAARDLFAAIGQVPESPEEERSVDLSLAALASMYVGDLDRATTLAEAGRAAGESSGNDFATVIGLMSAGAAARLQGRVAEALDLGAKSMHRASRVVTPWAGLFLLPAFHFGASCLEGDRLTDAEEAFRTGRTRSQQVGSWHIPWYEMYLAAKHFLAGDWDDAIAEATAGLSLVDEMEFTPFGAVLFPLGLIAAIALQRGDVARAATALATAEDELARSGAQAGFDAMLWAKALLLEVQGSDAPARTLLATAWAVYQQFGFHPAHRWVGADLVRLDMKQGDRAHAEPVVAQLENLAARSPIPTAQGVALRCRGLLDGDVEALVASVEAYRRGPRPFERALACEDAAIALARSGRVDAARPYFEEALDVYESVGAVLPIGRTEAALRQFGVRRGRRGSRRRPTSGWDSLTKTERRVVELVAAGMTNRAIGERLFISPRTVESHVAHVFQKLGVCSRTELVAEAVKRLG